MLSVVLPLENLPSYMLSSLNLWMKLDLIQAAVIKPSSLKMFKGTETKISEHGQETPQ